jgi:DNA-binding PadR family transcriptional regulator
MILSIRCTILGLLETRDRCGYELQRELCELLGGDFAADGRVYKALARLVGSGLIEKCARQETGGRARIPYAISPAGRAHLAGWLGQPLFVEAQHHDAVLARIVITGRSEPELLERHFSDLEEQFEGRMAQRDEALRACGGDSDLDFTRRIALLRHACRDRADLGWLRMVRAAWPSR